MPSHPPAEPPPQQAPSSPNKGRFKGILEAIKGKVLTPDVPALEFEPGPNTVSYEDYIGEGSFPGGFGPGDRPLSELPNYEKLTRTERWVQGKLAGVSAPVAKVLGKLNEGFLGKVLTVLDAPSEFIERTAGLSAQALAAVGTEETWSEFTNNLRNAWDAGTFAFDFTNLPIRKDGQIVFDDDLPGIDGVINARLRLTELTDGGMSNDDALEQVRAEVYEDAGALALRMQLHDAFFRIVGDPINLFLPRLKLVDRAKVGLLRRTAGKAVPELVETALRSVDEAATVGKITAEQADVGRAFIKSLPELTPWDERWMKVTGAIEFNGRAGTILADNELTGLAKFLRGRWNPFGLTPASRAHGLAVNLTDNVIAALAGTVDNPDEAVRLIVAAADGTFDPRIAHMIITNEGAMARGLLQGFSSEAQKLGNAWNLTKPNRNIFNFLRSSMGDDGNDLLVRMLQADEMQPIFTRAIESLGDNQDEFVRLLTSAGIDPNITPEKLFEIFEPLAKRGMLNTETFTGRLINEIGDFSAKAAATKFGVPTRGFISKMADLMKSAESMAFLRINPGYFVRNLVNGEMTGIGRMGIFRYVKGGAQKFLDRVGISPTRLRAGFGISGDVPEYYKKIAGGQEALKAIDDAILAASKGDASAMTKLADNIRGTKLPLDFGALSAKVESNQSFYMTAQSISEWMTKFHQAPEMPVALRSALGENRAVELTRAVANSLNDLEIEDVFLKTDAAINGRAVLDDASSAFGEDIMRTIKPSEAREMADDLIDAYKKSGPTGVRDEVAKIRGDVTQRYSEALKEATDEITKNIIDHVQHGGIDSALHYHSGMLDEFWGTVHGKYVDEFGSVFEQIKNADPKVASGLWETVRVRTRTYWDESWDLFEAQSKAITKGLNAWGKDAGQKFPWTADYANSFKSWRKGWEGFWKTRDTLIDEWVQARKAGKPIAYDTIRGQIDELYATTIAEEDVLFRQLDSLMARGVPEDFRAFYKAGREEIAGIRQLMREHVQRFQVDPLGDGRAYIDLTADEQIQAYQQFWRDRKGFLDEIVQSERKSRAAMRGDGEALGSYANAITNNETLDSARAAILAGEDLTEEQIEAIAKAREFLPETAELKRLRAEFGEFSDEVVEAKARQWADQFGAEPKLGDTPESIAKARLVEGDIEGVLAEGNIHDALRQWAFNDAEWKDEIIRLAQEDPNAIKEIQDFSQWMLREQGFDNLKLYGGKLRVYRGEAEVRLDELNLQAWDSFSPSKAIARQNAGPGGTMIELDIPVENIFTHVDAHPGFTFKGEREFMLNGTGIDGSRVVSINGNVPTPDELDILKNINPGLVVDAPFNANSLPDAEGVIGRIMPQDQGLFELWNMKGSKALDAIGESVIARGKRPPIKLDDLDDAARSQIRSYIEQSKANLASSRYQAIKFGEWRRDGALLNYSRRLNYNTWLGTVMPFEFWTTTSIRKWALHTLNRPTMTSTYLRLQDFLDKGYRPENGLPNRLKGQIRINAPFLPDFLGDSIFVDPLQLALPFKQWEYAIDSLTQNESRDAGRARRVLDELMNDEEITEQEYAQAIASESGPAWDRAISLARLDDTEGRTNAFDFMSLLTAPHAPIAWAYQALKGTPENIRPVLPLTRTVKGVTALLGIGPAGGVNIEGNIREFLGLPRFDKWDDYRTNRMLSNMVADQELTVQEAGLAMTSKQGEDYEEAKRRAGIEFGIGALGSTIGLPLKPYPPGEEFLRKLKDEYEAAWVDYERGDDTALNDFYTENPSYESRQLALEFEPEEQLRRFLVDQIWDKWNNLTVQNKRDVADGLGEVFQTAFLNKETRSLDNISSDMMQAWLQIMGGDTPGKVEWDQDLRPIELTPPTIARRLDAFYLTRSQNFRYNENVAPLWDTYFKLDKDARKKFFRENPILQQYIDWRNDFMFRNPELAPYVEDDPDKLPTFESLEELQEAEAAQPNFTWMEWQNVLTLPMWRLARDMLRYGEGMGDDEIEELIDVADGLGIEFEELMFRLEGAYEEAEGEFANPTAVP